MKRVLAIAGRIGRELLRDKRTLAMVLIMPILVLWLLNIMFSANTTTSVKIATVGVDSQITKTLDKTKHVSVVKYAKKSTANDKLKHYKVDAVLTESSSNHYKVTYANIDPTKTSVAKAALKAAILKGKMTTMAKTSAALQVKLAQLTGQTAQTSTLKTSAGATTKITNHYNYGDADTNFFSKMIPLMMGFFVFFFVFLISGMGMLGERTSGTLDRLLATPVKRGEIVSGYLISYGLLAVVQTIIVVYSAIWIMKIEVVGSVFSIIVINVLLALVALTFGMLLSTLASSEFQMMQFIPIVIVPQLLFSGIIPLDTMASWVQDFGKILPLTYAGDALTEIVMKGTSLANLGGDICALLIFIVVLGSLNILAMKRYRKV